MALENIAMNMMYFTSEVIFLLGERLSAYEGHCFIELVLIGICELVWGHWRFDLQPSLYVLIFLDVVNLQAWFK